MKLPNQKYKSTGSALKTLSAFIIFVTSLSVQAQKQPEPVGGGTDQYYDHFFKVNDQQNQNLQAVFSGPIEMTMQFMGTKDDGASGNLVNLLAWIEHEEAFGTTPEKYNRKNHFGSWIKVRRGQKCFYTRSEVLKRDSTKPVELKPDDSCIVSGGLWDDPYTGEEISDPGEIQIDHFVPLKNAYVSGGWAWSKEKRCLYANFLENSIHLISVDGPENMAKGWHGPEQYMPPNEKFSCEYLQRWLKIKLIWDLGMTPPEAAAIDSLVKQKSCKLSSLMMAKQELIQQRSVIYQKNDFCKNPPIQADTSIKP